MQPDLRRLSLADITGDIRTTMLDELDFQKEAKNMAEFRSFLASSGNKAVMCPDVYPAASSKKVLYLLYMCPYHSSAYLGLPVHTPMYLVFLYYYISSVLILVCCAGADDASSSRPHTLVAEGRIY